MTKLSHIMKEYFVDTRLNQKSIQSENILRRSINESNVPIRAKKVEWVIESGPERFIREFIFNDRRRMRDFVNEIFAYEDEINHHSSLSIDHKKVTVEINTKTLEKITERDVEFTQELSKIYKDVLNYQYGKSNEF